MQVAELRDERAKIDDAVREFVLTNYEGGEGYEDDVVKITKVQGHKRVWNAERLQELLPRGVFKNVVMLVPNAAKINEYVSAGKIDLDEIEDALEETATAPYVKVTRKSQSGDHEAAADELAEKLA